jgi:hypothetical protein
MKNFKFNVFGLTVNKVENSIYILSNKEIKKGDQVLAVSGYPHWLGFPQECTLVFKDETIGLRGCVRVNKHCFKKLKTTISWNK